MSFIAPYLKSRQMKIGLLGGSFNPAHQGHIDLSLKAYKKCQLDEIWWMITPQNPLKNERDTKDYKTRLTFAKSLTQNHPFIKISDYENELISTYTIDTISTLTNTLPNHKFIWVCGADSFISLPKWKDWENIMKKIPFFIASRPSYHEKTLQSLPARKFIKYAQPQEKFRTLIHKGGKYWGYDDTLCCPASSTKIRQIQKNGV